MVTWETCDKCSGSGQFEGADCPECEGTGYVFEVQDKERRHRDTYRKVSSGKKNQKRGGR